MATSNFLRDYERTVALYTDASPSYHRACALTLMGALLLRQNHRCVIERGVSGTWTNMWTVLIGDSGTSHKSTAINMSEQVLLRVDPDLRGADDMSPEGLLNHLRTREQLGNDPSLFLYFSEWINLLLQMRRSYSQVLRSTLLKLYDVDPVLKRQLKKESFEIHHPRISMVGGLPAEMLAQYGTDEDWAGGFFNRCLFIQGKPVRVQKDTPRIKLEVYDRLAEQLSAVLQSWREYQEHREYPQISVSKEATKVAEGLSLRVTDPHLETMLSRSRLHWLKVAAIEQVDEDPESSEIRKGAAIRAAEFISEWQASLPEIIGNCHTLGRDAFEGDRLPKKVLRFLARSPDCQATQADLLAKCAMSYYHLKQALDTLISANQIVFVEVNNGVAVRLKKAEAEEKGPASEEVKLDAH